MHNGCRAITVRIKYILTIRECPNPTVLILRSLALSWLNCDYLSLQMIPIRPGVARKSAAWVLFGASKSYQHKSLS